MTRSLLSTAITLLALSFMSAAAAADGVQPLEEPRFRANAAAGGAAPDGGCRQRDAGGIPRGA